MTPKSLLRHPKVVSPLDELARGPLPARHRRFDGVGRRRAPDSAVQRQDLLRPRREARRTRADDVAIVRLEQLYPLRDELLAEALASYAPASAGRLGAGRAGEHGRVAVPLGPFRDRLFGAIPFSGVCRPASASPATGWRGAPQERAGTLLKAAFDAC